MQEQRHTTTDDLVDIAIVCALEVEREAVCRELQLGDQHRVLREGYRYWRGAVQDQTGLNRSVVVAQLNDMTNPASAVGTSAVIHVWRPAALLLVGIAAAAEDSQRLGDVVVGTRVVWHEPGKATEEGHRPELAVISADNPLLHAARTASLWVPAIDVRRPERKKGDPQRHFGAIASGEIVIADAERRNQVAKMDRKIRAIEMEGYGFCLAALHEWNRPRHLVIRALCDYANGIKNDKWHSYAAAAAASFAHHLITDWPFEPLNLPQVDSVATSSTQPALQSREDERIAIAAAEKAKLDRIFSAPGWLATLSDLYDNENSLPEQRYPLLELMGEKFPIWTYPAPVDQRSDLESALYQPVDAAPNFDAKIYHESYNQDTELLEEFAELIAAAETKSMFNGAAYVHQHLRNGAGGINIAARRGWYFHSLVTSERLDLELMNALVEDPYRPVPLHELTRRAEEHRVTDGDPVRNGTSRSAALSVSAVMIFPTSDGGYKVLLPRRSDTVATHPGFYHVAPSGIFSPIDPAWKSPQDEFSVEQSIVREYAEELFDYKTLERGFLEDGTPAYAGNLDANPRIRGLRAAHKNGDVSIRYCGISVNLLTLRPEIHLVVLVHNIKWWEDERRAGNEDGKPLRFNWEYEFANEGSEIFLQLDANFEIVPTPDKIHPRVMVPNAAAAIALALPVARALIARGTGSVSQSVPEHTMDDTDRFDSCESVSLTNTSNSPHKEVFISYVSEDAALVDRLVGELEKNGVSVWRDRTHLLPGQRWKAAIRSAIREGAYFIACFSEASEKRGRSYMREELTIAIEEVRRRPNDTAWFLPVKLNNCEIPDIEISATETITDLQNISLEPDWMTAMRKLLQVLK